jgi:hypothetical protein
MNYSHDFVISPGLYRLCESVLRFVRSFERRGQTCRCWQKTIARYLQASLRSVQRALTLLKVQGRLAVQFRGPRPAEYATVEAAAGQGGAAAQPQSSAEVAKDSGGAFGGAFTPHPYMNLVESLVKWRKEVLVPTVLFLKPRAPKPPTQTIEELTKAVEAIWETQGWKLPS